MANQFWVAQGSLVSPLLFVFSVDDLITELSGRFEERSVFASADNIATLCLGYSDERAALDIVERWSVVNSMELNKKKCGVLDLCKKSMPLDRKEIGGVSFVSEYKYLGVPLDQSLTLNRFFLRGYRSTK